jgi:hypothetical protein
MYGLLNVIHAAPIDSDINNTALDLCNTADDAKVSGPLLYGEQTGYQSLDMGAYDWCVAAAGNCGSSLFDIPTFEIRAGTRFSLVIYGGANGQPLATVLIVEDAGKAVRLLPIIRVESAP